MSEQKRKPLTLMVHKDVQHSKIPRDSLIVHALRRLLSENTLGRASHDYRFGLRIGAGDRGRVAGQHL